MKRGALDVHAKRTSGKTPRGIRARLHIDIHCPIDEPNLGAVRIEGVHGQLRGGPEVDAGLVGKAQA